MIELIHVQGLRPFAHFDLAELLNEGRAEAGRSSLRRCPRASIFRVLSAIDGFLQPPEGVSITSFNAIECVRELQVPLPERGLVIREGGKAYNRLGIQDGRC